MVFSFSFVRQLARRYNPGEGWFRPWEMGTTGMAIEIERKFLVAGEFLSASASAIRIVQGYLNSAPERSVRVRLKGDQGFLTVKGIGNSSGMTRFEWEKEISVLEADELLALCEPGVIDKVRHIVPFGRHNFEVDVFAGDNLGLIIAELELASEEESFERPEWLGLEVTGEARYFNASLARHPFVDWSPVD